MRRNVNFARRSSSFWDIPSPGLMPDHSHLEAIRNAPPPSDEPTLRSFLGLTAWYAKFIPNYASVVEPMRDAL